ncbi:MAG: dodecin domain-containing protein [Gammaproteobacteria bacterium]|nr:dodecin domain-containing protein [Gammaproteobacteria bacterium]MCP5199606.1 dodecin domain-containing protein [Gammaproteobacteria bacterium]
MSEHVYKHIELTGSSTKSIEDAVEGAVKRAATTVRNMRWFEVEQIRGQVDQQQVSYWQVVLKIGFTLEP